MKLKEYSNKTFENIKHIDEFGNEYWKGRELQKVLEYARWDKFSNVINKAKIACTKSNNKIEDYFSHVGKIVKTGVSEKKIDDYKLSRYACYLIVQNADSRKKVVALGQTYFAIQTRKQELSEEEYKNLTEDEKRLYKRKKTKDKNLILYKVAKESGVKNFDKFTNYGYKGLYNGETADDIAKRKKLRYREEILDNMGSEELSTNEFRISQTEAKLKRDKIKSEKVANDTHYKVGKTIRKAIKEIGGTMPENLPTPKKSIKEIKKITKNKIMLLIIILFSIFFITGYSTQNPTQKGPIINEEVSFNAINELEHLVIENYLNKIIGTIEFPGFNQINEIVLGTDDETLDKHFVGLHYLSENLDKKPNNIILAAHNREGLFEIILNLKYDDIIKINSLENEYTFKVVKIERVDKNKLMRFIQSDQRVVTLITCIENDEKRLIITLIEI